MRVCGTCREIEISQFGQPRMLMAGNRHHLAMMQAELAGKAQDLFRLARDGKHDRQRVAGHIVGYRKIGSSIWLLNLPTLEKKRAPYFASAPEVPAPTKIIRSEARIISTACSSNSSNSSLLTLLKAHYFAGADICLLRLILLEI